MESKHKNALIGALLAVVFVMAVGYAAFAQQLQINGTATITSTWDVHFDETKDEDSGAVSAEPGIPTATTQPSGTITYGDEHTATLSATLIQPGDKVTYTLTIENGGNITANLGTPTVTMEGDTDGTGNLTATKGNIKFTVTNPNPTTIAERATATMTVIAEYINNPSGNANSQNETASVDIQIDATQATA